MTIHGAETLIAATVAITFFLIGLISVYQRNEEYDAIKLQQNKETMQSTGSSASNQNEKKQSDEEVAVKKSKFLIESGHELKEDPENGDQGIYRSQMKTGNIRRRSQRLSRKMAVSH